MPLCSAFSKTLVVPSTVLPPPPTANKNWNPGNYIGATSSGAADWNKTNGILQRLQNDTGNKWRGALLRFQWDELERAEGEYEWLEGTARKGFHVIADCLDQISNLAGKRLIIFFQVKTFGATDHAVPAYMRNSATYADGKDFYQTRNGVRMQGSYSGEYAYTPPAGSPNPNGGYVPNLHVAAVRERLKALMQAFATKFNNDTYMPYIEAIAFSEASINNPMGAVGLANQTVVENGVSVTYTRPNTQGGSWSGENTWYNNMTNAFTAIRTALPDVQVCQWINSPRDNMQTWVPDIVAAGVGLGMPDMSKDTKAFLYNPTLTPGQPPGNIYWMNQYPNTAIRMGHCSKPTLESTVMNDTQTANDPPATVAYPGVSWSRQALATWSKDSAAVTHRIWAHNSGNHVVSTLYNGQNFNTVTDAWIQNAGSDITVNTTRPTGW